MGGVICDCKSHIKYDGSEVIPITPGLSGRWFDIAGAFLGFYKIGSSLGRRVGDGEALVRRGWLEDKATCESKAEYTARLGKTKLLEGNLPYLRWKMRQKATLDMPKDMESGTNSHSLLNSLRLTWNTA
jgi:hypothetical protein